MGMDETKSRNIKMMEAMLASEEYGPWMIGSIKYLIKEMRGADRLAQAVSLVLVLEAQTKHAPGASPELVRLSPKSREQLEEALKAEAPEAWEKVETSREKISG